MTRPTLTLPVTLAVGDVLAARDAGMVPGAAVSALMRALDRCGDLEMAALRQEWAEYQAAVDAENDRKLGREAKR